MSKRIPFVKYLLMATAFFLAVICPTQATLQHPLNVVKVAIQSPDPEVGRQLDKEMQQRVAALRISGRDFKADAFATELSPEDGCRGYIGALVVETNHGKFLFVFLASDLPSLARQFAERMDEVRKEKK